MEKKRESRLFNYATILIVPSLAILFFIAAYADPTSGRGEFLLSMVSNIMIGFFILGLGLLILAWTSRT